MRNLSSSKYLLDYYSNILCFFYYKGLSQSYETESLESLEQSEKPIRKLLTSIVTKISIIILTCFALAIIAFFLAMTVPLVWPFTLLKNFGFVFIIF